MYILLSDIERQVGRWCVCVKLRKTTKRLELGVLDALVGDLQQELRFLVYDGSEGFGESPESRCCTRPRDRRERCSLVFVAGTFIREGYFEWLDTRIELQLTQTCDLSRTGGWDFLATRCLGWVKIDWRRRDSPEGGRDDLICGMRFEGAYGFAADAIEIKGWLAEGEGDCMFW